MCATSIHIAHGYDARLELENSLQPVMSLILTSPLKLNCYIFQLYLITYYLLILFLMNGLLKTIRIPLTSLQ